MDKKDIFAAMKAHAEQELPPNHVLYRPSDQYWKLALPTFLENWPSDLYTLSIASTAIPLTEGAVRTLGSYILELGEGWEPPTDREDLRRILISSLDRAIGQYPRGAFIRLGSRSPKDAMYWGFDPGKQVPNGEIKTGQMAFDLLTACSERIYEDLQMQLAMGYNSVIWVREGLDIPEWSEFRCFMKDRRLIGISQYYYHKPHPEIVEHSESIRWAIEQFFDNDFKEASHLDSVVFDVFIKRHQVHDMVSYQVKLLEINPFFNLCDPCLFDWNRPEMFQGQLRYRKELGGHRTGVENTSGFKNDVSNAGW